MDDLATARIPRARTAPTGGRSVTIEVNGQSYVPLSEMSEALDEMFRLRRALAYEASVVEAQTMDVKALGIGRRGHLEDSIERMQLAALGDSEIAYAGQLSRSLRHALRRIEARETLTRWNWRNTRTEAPESGRQGGPDDALTAQRDALVEIMRGIVEASRPYTEPEVLRLAWKRLHLAIALHDQRVNAPEFMERMAEVKADATGRPT